MGKERGNKEPGIGQEAKTGGKRAIENGEEKEMVVSDVGEAKRETKDIATWMEMDLG